MKTLISVAATLLFLTAGAVGQSCTLFNTGTPGGDSLWDYSDKTQHLTGLHYMDAWHYGNCVYENPIGGHVGSPCTTEESIFDNPETGESGFVSGADHLVATNGTAGSTNCFGCTTSATAEAVAGVGTCPFYSCNISVSLAGVVTITPQPAAQIWSRKDYYTSSCQGHILGCPIIIDTAHEGFQLTSASDGVVTDMVIPGHKIQFAWTARGSHNAFLWLDNHLFGNSTPQPPSDDPNGFAALAVYDSNNDGVIDRQDPVFSRLRLWIDANHDGETQPDELYTLPELGVYAINLEHKAEKYYDKYGNLYHYRGSLKTAARDVDRTIYDVYFAYQPFNGLPKN